MKKNMGLIDRTVRVILALLFIVLIIAKALTGTLAVILGIVAVVFLLTAIVSFCPLYVPVKLSTLKKKE
jgi:hypothetical protein